VIARQPEAARSVIEARAREIEAPLMRQGVEWDTFESRGRLVVQTDTRVLDLPLPALSGAHQIDNAGLACAALMAWREFPDEAFATGVVNALWPGRLQPLTRGPFSAPIRAEGGEVWIDSGHNAHAAAALARELDGMRVRRGGTNIAIIGLRARKDADAFVCALAPSLTRLIAVPLEEESVDPNELARIARDAGLDGGAAKSLEAAMQSAAQSPAPRTLICGSLLLAAEALAQEQVSLASSSRGSD
jgi:dihydrofolate synthase/folylpolyglutamate synthase